jgi:hypothetical protein
MTPCADAMVKAMEMPVRLSVMALQIILKVPARRKRNPNICLLRADGANCSLASNAGYKDVMGKYPSAVRQYP